LKKHLNILIISLAVSLIVSGLFLAGTLERMELLTIDLRYRVLPGHGPGSELPVTVVALDQNSIKKMGRWPIQREYYITVLKNLYRDGARGVLMDMDFSSIGPDPEQDDDLARYVQQFGTVVLAAQMNERITDDGVLLRNVSLPYPALKSAAMAMGSITFGVDLDGVVRRMPPSIDFIDEVYRPLGAVGAAMIEPGPSTAIPTGALINMKVLAQPTFTVIPFQKVLQGEFETGVFQDRVVLLGATSADLHDLWLTPLGVIPGVFIQVAVLDTVLNGSWYQQQGNVSAIIAFVLLSLVSGWFMATRSWKGGALVLASLLAVVTGTAVFTAGAGQFIQVVPLLLVCLIMYPVQVTARARRVDVVLERERGKTEAFLSIAALRMAEEEGQESHFVPLVLCGQLLDLTTLQVFTLGNGSGTPVDVRTVIGDQSQEPDPELLQEVLEKGVCLTLGQKGGGTAILVPIGTVRKTLGVLYAESRKAVGAEDEDVRLLLSFATQTAYFMESLSLDLRVKDLYINTIRAISRALDSKDQYTSAHSELSLDHVEKFGKICGLGREQIESLHVGALLHDIGKIGVPDNILAKEESLSMEEYEVIKGHPVIGSDIVRGLPFPDEVKMIIKHHHERFDGTGYPDGLKGEEIPLLVRIFSIMDVYEALVGFRPYRNPLSAESAADLLQECSGTQFDPDLLDLFFRCIAPSAED
jgi:putative nucleotidyltransferase with HDIG domain